MEKSRIVIVGGGLSGLYAAWMLERQGVRDFVVLEARSVLGGRIASVNSSGEPALYTEEILIDRFDLGPTWFWPEHQHQLHELIAVLGLERFEQFGTGDTLIERSPAASPQRVHGYANSPISMRLVGGMTTLVDALRGFIDPARILTGTTVRRLRCDDGFVSVESVDAAGGTVTRRAEKILLALPPRLVAELVTFEPRLPTALLQQWISTATWMASHAKYLAVYDSPFWRDQGLSGEARSACGPMVEIHDASMPGGSAALFGFLGVPARARMGVADAVLAAHCRTQLVRLFGPQAATPRAEVIKDWAMDPYTSTTADLDAPAAHAAAPARTPGEEPWRGRLTGIASEWSPNYPGYLAGAVEAAALGVDSTSRH